MFRSVPYCRMTQLNKIDIIKFGNKEIKSVVQGNKRNFVALTKFSKLFWKIMTSYFVILVDKSINEFS